MGWTCLRWKAEIERWIYHGWAFFDRLCSHVRMTANARTIQQVGKELVKHAHRHP
jgi:hypothetical protein